MNKELQDLAISIFDICLRNSISLEMEWITRFLNEKADYLSKIIDQDDWGISAEVFSLIESRFGKLSIDWFASEHNAKLPRFYSKFWNPSSLGVDAFTVNWTNEFGLFVPPFYLIHRVLNKMCLDQAKGILVVPVWKSAPLEITTGALVTLTGALFTLTGTELLMDIILI
jgi:hypothetical protein